MGNIGIDLVTKSQDGALNLVLVLPDPWNGSDAQLTQLQTRLNEYMAFALDGELHARFPEARNAAVRIRVDAHCQLDPHTLEFLGQVRGLVQHHGLDLVTGDF